MLISGLLAMIRGFMREVLSIAAWARGRGRDALLLYNRLLPIAKAIHHQRHRRRPALVIGGVFLVTLLIVSIITVEISDMILDSRIGALDRTLGFLFGLGRGLIIVVVAFLFFAWLVPDRKQPEWRDATPSRASCCKAPANGCSPCCRRTWKALSVAVVQEAARRRRAGAAGQPAGQRSSLGLAGRAAFVAAAPTNV